MTAFDMITDSVIIYRLEKTFEESHISYNEKKYLEGTVNDLFLLEDCHPLKNEEEIQQS